MSICFYTD